MERECKKVYESEITQIYLIKQEYLDAKGKLRQGWMMNWICEIASKVAVRHSESDVTVRTVDHQAFYNPVDLSGVIVLKGKMIHAGETLMEVQVDVFMESEWRDRRKISRSYVTLDAVDEKMCPRSIPGLWTNSGYPQKNLKLSFGN